MVDVFTAGNDSPYTKQFNHTLHVFIDITDDLVAGTLLSQIVYWFRPNEKGESKLRVKKHGEYWLVKSRSDWKKEIRITEKQYDRAIKILEEKGLVEVELHRYNNTPTCHIRPIKDEINKRVNELLSSSKPIESTILPKGENQILPKEENGDFTETGKSLTEITHEITLHRDILVPEKSSGDSEPLIDKKYGIPEDLGLLDDERKEIWIKVIKYHILLTEKWNNNKRHRKHKPDYWRKWISDSEEVITVRLRGNFSYELGKRIIDYYFNIEKPCGDGEFAALWNERNLKGVLNKLYGGSRSDYEEAGMIEEKMEFHNSVRELEFV